MEYSYVIVYHLQIESKDDEMDESPRGLLVKFKLESPEETTFLFASDPKFNLKGEKADSIVGRSVVIYTLQENSKIKDQVACGVVEDCDLNCQNIFVL